VVEPLLETRTHRRIGFGQDQLVEVIGVVGQVEASAAAYVDRAPSRVTEKLLPKGSDSGPLADPHERVVGNREGASPDRRSL
jgi:hypothetical protein